MTSSKLVKAWLDVLHEGPGGWRNLLSESLADRDGFRLPDVFFDAHGIWQVWPLQRAAG